MQSDQNRSQRGCLCCGNPKLRHETTLVSGFLAERAWNGPPELTKIAFCDECGFRFFERGLSRTEADKLYLNYRDADYFRHRNRWEPFYTRTQHEAVVTWSRSPSRATELRKIFDQARLPVRFQYALDHGGNEGHMLLSVDAKQKLVFDPSGRPVLPGMSAVSAQAEIPFGCDLLLSCQVLEHISDPQHYLRQVSKLCAEDAYLYVEVPGELWSNHVCHGPWRDAWLRLLLRHRHLQIFADMLSTGCRVILGFLPPMGFIPMREHLNYFTIKALDSLLVASGLAPISSGRNAEGQLFAIARKAASTANN